MFEIDISTAVALYLFVPVIAFLFGWIIFEESRSRRKLDLEEKSIWQCFICSYTYIDSKHDNLSVCPRCGSYNRRILPQTGSE